MSDKTNIFIDGEHAATIVDLKHDEPWHYGTLEPGGAFDELKKSLEIASYAKKDGNSTELVAGQDTVDRVSWGADVDSSETITRLTLSQWEAGGPWELEFTCEPAGATNGAK
ncbi:MAG: hypothetical protein IT462_06100 [Planctomycetes bacterium]|nr:hypothetical protein [Planctomycetota bacterium]